MPPLASLTPYLRSLQDVRANPYTSLAGRSGQTYGFEAGAVGDAPGNQVGDSGAGAELDRMIAAEAAQARSADLTNWLDRQRAERVDAMLERDDPEAAARVRATQLAGLRPQSTSTPVYDDLQKMLMFRSPTATASRQQAIQERTGEQLGLEDQRRNREAIFFNSPIARANRQTQQREGLAQKRAGRLQDLELALDPRATYLRQEDVAGRISAAQAANPPDWRIEAMRQSAAQGAAPAAGSAGPAAAPKTVTRAEVEQQMQLDPELQGFDIEDVIDHLTSQGYTIVQ